MFPIASCLFSVYIYNHEWLFGCLLGDDDGSRLAERSVCITSHAHGTVVLSKSRKKRVKIEKVCVLCVCVCVCECVHECVCVCVFVCARVDHKHDK